MTNVRKLGLVSLGSLMMACSAGTGSGTDVPMGESDDSIIRATSETGKDQVVMVFATQIVGGRLQYEFCSGTYTASRVVITAAHCLQSIWNNQVFVYFGDDAETDFDEMVPNGSTLVPPPPGQPSHWAQADSFEVHPDYDANLNHPDLAAIYLDRKLPFDPMPIARFRIDNSYIGKKMQVMGWGAGVATGPVTADEYAIERTGKQSFLGNPTAADYHTDDPNAGLLDPHVRRDLFKMDGKAPGSNMCFGDSGGAMLVSKNGKTYLGGVFFWTGFYCEDYSIFTRMDPFLDFTDKAEKKGGKSKLTPDLDCVAPNADGSYTAYFGYDNKNAVSLDIPKGPKNSLPLDVHGWRPTHFRPGSHDFAFGVDFTKHQTLVYSLDPDASPRTTLYANRHSKACSAAQTPMVGCGNRCKATELSGCVMPDFETCMEQCNDTNAFFAENYPECSDALTAWNQCIGGTAPGEDNWSCWDETTLPDSLSCDGALGDLYTCLGY
jgi:hypothetical protein